MNKKLLSELGNANVPLLTDSQLKFLNNAYSIIERKVDGYATRALPSTSDEVPDVMNQVYLIEKNFIAIINHLKGGRFAKKSFVEIYPIWKKIREDGIGNLKEIADSINADRFNCNVSKLVGYNVSLIGGAVCLVSAALIPFTMGLTTPLAFAGGSFTAAGCTTAIGTSVTEFVLLKKKVGKAQEIIEEDKKYYQKMNDWLTHARELEKAIAEVLCIDIIRDVAKSVKKFIDDALNIANEFRRLNFMQTGINEIFNYIPRSILDAIPLATIGTLIVILLAYYLLLQNSENRLVFDCASLTMRIIVGVGSLLDDSMDIMRLSSLFTGSTVAAKDLAKAVTRGAVAVFGIALDVAAIALTSIDIHKGSISPQAEKITNAWKEMKEEAELLEEVYNNLH